MAAAAENVANNSKHCVHGAVRGAVQILVLKASDYLPREDTGTVLATAANLADKATSTHSSRDVVCQHNREREIFSDQHDRLADFWRVCRFRYSLSQGSQKVIG